MLVPALAAGTAALVVAGVVSLGAAEGGPAGTRSYGEEQPALSAQVIQERRDAVLRRFSVAVENLETRPIVVTRLRLVVPGFDSPGPIAKDSPIPPGQVVNLPWSYGRPRCPPGEATPEAGTPRVALRVRVGTDEPAEVRLVPTIRDGVIGRTLQGECLARRIRREVSLTFGPWRVAGSGDDVRLRGTLEVRLRDPRRARAVTQVAGSVIYDLAPDGPSRAPLARVDASAPAASVPVVVTQARCDGHAVGEVKKPYAFLVWLAEPGGPEQAASIEVSAEDEARFQAVCRL
ncbi:MAG: hypothetical protein ACRDV1_05420 [Actinomycetes bacterium]